MEKSGIVSYGWFVGRYYRKLEENNIGLLEQRIAHPYIDSVSAGWYAAKEAIKKADIDKNDIASVYFCSETPAYKVKSSAIIVAEMLGLNKLLETKDVQNACASGLNALITALRETESKDFNGKYALVVFADCAPIKKENIFYDKVGHGAAAFIVGDNPIAIIKRGGVNTVFEDVNDFFIRHDDPANPICNGRQSMYYYKKLVYESINRFLENAGKDINDFEYVIGHTPVPNMPYWMTNFEREKRKHEDLYELNPFKDLKRDVKEVFKYNFINRRIGNAFAANFGLILCNYLDNAKHGDKVLGYVYGSGASASTISIRPAKRIKKFAKGAKLEDAIKMHDKRFELNEYMHDKFMNKRINAISKGVECAGKSVVKTNYAHAHLIEYNGKTSRIRIGDKECTAEVIGCDELQAGTKLELIYKCNKGKQGPVIYTPAYREFLFLTLDRQKAHKNRRN